MEIPSVSSHQQHQQPQQQPIGSNPTPNAKLKLLLFDISECPTYIQFLSIAGVMMLCFMISGITQEYIFTKYEGFDFGFFLTLGQFAVYASCAAVERFYLSGKGVEESKKRHPEMLMHPSESGYFSRFSVATTTLPLVDSQPKGVTMQILKYYLFLGSSMVIGMGFGNESLAYLNYPTKILFKSCKLLVTMFVGVLLLGKRYKYLDYVASVFLIFGLITLYGANLSETNIKFESAGVILISCALLFDSIASNLQEKILTEFERTENELIFYSYMIGSAFLTVICLLTNQLLPALMYCLQNPSILVLMVGYSLISYTGALYVNKLIKMFGILVTMTTTSTRKVLSILISYFIFPKPLSMQHVFAVLLVFTGVFIRVYCKQKEAIDEKIHQWFKIDLRRFGQEKTESE